MTQNSIEFFMPMLPPKSTAQMKKVTVVNGKPVFYEPDDLKAARSKLMAHLGKHVPKDKYTSAVRLTSWWLFQATGNHKNGQYKTTKPDTDNMVKLLKDCMTDLNFWTDDCLVASEVIEKYWADVPGIFVRIEAI
ncbi:RusA family crossover junction endodeoxyribonuclease [Anaerobacillus isosaccharinicus]|uniref:Crossover junction endodeoxyribonuclease RuvA n=1 Tax=Anaerobacillus isosaccharinicus TaxID=1532552 RepID=A0A1S2LAJ2_9BACI|nr:RusA family crossover junction endodeoxyribonuclease [Anaerobacillus isosaccharinicus]MBA5584557.1 RusA family crossover junction endodeoxyribonuclease [Anaerobacillus isosaccharinicus]QOY37059.1 RusA family crossover junction endodeoxyribonuclease [Anaerobacillus isosaccharinicus]